MSPKRAMTILAQSREGNPNVSAADVQRATQVLGCSNGDFREVPTNRKGRYGRFSDPNDEPQS